MMQVKIRGKKENVIKHKSVNFTKIGWKFIDFTEIGWEIKTFS